MHTARWDHDVDLRGKRVAIVGTGASAVQVIPTIAPEVERLTVLQRTPIWCLPKPDGEITPRSRRLLERVPGAQRAARALSQAYVELTFPLAAHYHGTLKLATAGRKTGAEAAARPGPRPGRPRQADAALRARLQAAELLQRVPAGLQPRQRLPRDLADRGVHARRRAHRGGRARGRRARSSRPASRSSRRATCRRTRCAAGTASTSPSGGTRTASRPTRASASPASRTCS